jgi:hypothetical protein
MEGLPWMVADKRHLQIQDTFKPNQLTSNQLEITLKT